KAQDGIGDRNVTGVQTCALPICTMKFRMTSHAWLAAIDYMKYVYLGGAALVAACIIFVAWTLEQSCRKSAEAEAQRRDFTNAMEIGRASCRERVKKWEWAGRA